MNSSRTTSRLAIVALLVLAACVPTFAATATDDIIISGTVAARISITATPTSAATAFDIMAGVVDKTPIATVIYSSNYRAGYAVTLSSGNAWKFSQTGGTDVWAYQLYFGSDLSSASQLTLGSGAATLASGGKSNETEKTLFITFAAPPVNGLNEGLYSDTLVFTITGS